MLIRVPTYMQIVMHAWMHICMHMYLYANLQEFWYSDLSPFVAEYSVNHLFFSLLVRISSPNLALETVFDIISGSLIFSTAIRKFLGIQLKYFIHISSAVATHEATEATACLGNFLASVSMPR